jgi:ATP-binding cassette subfamily B protein
MGQPAQSSRNLGKTLRQLLGRLRPEWHLITFVVLLGSASVAFSVIGPKIIGNATNVIFDGIIGKNLPAGMTKAQAIALLRAHGQDQIAQMLSGMNVTPGKGIDFTQLGVILLLAALVYVLAALLSWAQGYIMAGVAQRTVYGMRRDVEAKLARLPLKYFDSHPHGDILSRVTNDIDNVTTTLQQGLSQLLIAVLTVVGVLAMMFSISPLLAAISLITVPLSIGVTILVARRSVAVDRDAQRSRRGDAHRSRAGPGLRPPAQVARGVRQAEPDAV